MSLQVAPLRSAVITRSTGLTNALFIVGGISFLSLLAKISIPVPGSPVPVTGQTLGVLIIGTTYGALLGSTTFALYLLAGVLGAPIFAPSESLPSYGLARLTSATGGYLVGMLLASLLLGYLADRRADQKFKTSYISLLSGTAIIFIFGVSWLKISLGMSWSAAIAAGFTPFILGEALKIAITATSLPLIWRKISKKLS